ncbi:MAG: ABC-F family ATP-binding cassette domain-containing protein [Planctomycetota bacterium]
MSVLIIRGLEKHFGALEVLRGLDLAIEAGEKVGVVGRNGGGKTTMMRIAAGIEPPERGELTVPRGTRVGYVAQRPEFEPGVRAFEYVEHGLDEVKTLLAEAKDLESHLAEYEGEALERAVERFGRVTEQIDLLDGWNAERQAEVVLDGIGLSRELWEREARTLSGGEKARVAMARELVRRPDLLMLDEPTNHLDLEGIEWLENYLREYRGALMLISHDRRMLDRVVTVIVELEWGQLRRYPGNYNKYVDLRQERFASELRAWEIQRDKIRKEQQFIKKHMGSQRTSEAKGRQKRLQRVERLERPYDDVRKPILRLTQVERSGETIVSCEDLSIGHGANVLAKGLELRIARGDRIALVGPNGAGKTTLMRTLCEKKAPLAGEVKKGHKAEVGYFDQESGDLDPAATPFTTMRKDWPTATDEEIRSHLALFLFRGDDVDAEIGRLSGGERARVALARLIGSKPTWLALDEPTNHLDLAARTALEEMLSGFPGAMLCISHDREFMDNLCNKVWELGPKGFREFRGNYSEYRAAIEAERAAEVDRRAAAAAKASKPQPAPPKPEQARKSKPAPQPAPKPQQAAAAPAKAAKNQPKNQGGQRVRNPYLFEKLEKEIMALEEEKERLTREMQSEEVYRDHEALVERQYRLAEIERDLEEKNETWANWS